MNNNQKVIIETPEFTLTNDNALIIKKTVFTKDELFVFSKKECHDDFTVFDSITDIFYENSILLYDIKKLIITETGALNENTISRFTGIKSISVDEKNPYYTTKDGVLFSKDKKYLICYPPQKEGLSYTIPSTVEKISDVAFTSVSKLEDLHLGDNITCLHGSIDCKKLKTITFGRNLKKVSYSSLKFCTDLEEINANENTKINFNDSSTFAFQTKRVKVNYYR